MAISSGNCTPNKAVVQEGERALPFLGGWMPFDVLQCSQDLMALPNEIGGMCQPPSDPATIQVSGGRGSVLKLIHDYFCGLKGTDYVRVTLRYSKRV